MTADAGDARHLNLSGKNQPHLLRILAKGKPARVSLDGQAVREGEGWRFDAGNQRLIITTRDCQQGAYVMAWR